MGITDFETFAPHRYILCTKGVLQLPLEEINIKIKCLKKILRYRDRSLRLCEFDGLHCLALTSEYLSGLRKRLRTGNPNSGL